MGEVGVLRERAIVRVLHDDATRLEMGVAPTMAVHRPAVVA
jgi:hypothetical protein